MPAACGVVRRLWARRKEQDGDRVCLPLFLGALGFLPPWLCVGPGLNQSLGFQKVGDVWPIARCGPFTGNVSSLLLTGTPSVSGGKHSLQAMLRVSHGEPSSCTLAGRGARDATLQGLKETLYREHLLSPVPAESQYLGEDSCGCWGIFFSFFFSNFFFFLRENFFYLTPECNL